MADKISFQDLLKQLSDNIEEDNMYYIQDKYAIDTCYKDNDFSIIDANKYIHVNPKQINITQENHSQVIPFKFNRFWDGIDLVDEKKENDINFVIHYKNINNLDGAAEPINVCYDDKYIYFQWLIDKYVTYEPGTLTFEICAIGTHNNMPYVWRTRPNKEITIIQGMTEGISDWGELQETWIDLLLKKNLISEETLEKIIFNMLANGDINIEDTYLESVELVSSEEETEEEFNLLKLNSENENENINTILKLTLNNKKSIYVDLFDVISDIAMQKINENNNNSSSQTPDLNIINSTDLVVYVVTDNPKEEDDNKIITAQGLRQVLRQNGYNGEYNTDY